MDIVTHIIASLRDHAPQDVLSRVEREIRSEYGGARVYVPKTTDDAQRELIERHRNIWRDWRAGESVTLIARRYGMSRRRVYEILKEYSGRGPSVIASTRVVDESEA